MSDKIELMMLCGVLQSNFSCLSQSESRTQLCHVRINLICVNPHITPKEQDFYFQILSKQTMVLSTYACFSISLQYDL